MRLACGRRTVLGAALCEFGRIGPVEPDACLIDLDRIAVHDPRGAFHRLSVNRARQQGGKQDSGEGAGDAHAIARRSGSLLKYSLSASSTSAWAVVCFFSAAARTCSLTAGSQ
jgi:hypothetical protein